MEINSQPERLDLKDTDARLARDRGVKLAINSDSHSAWQFGMTFYGVETARRGWVKPGDVLNTMPLMDLLSWLKDRTIKSGRLRLEVIIYSLAPLKGEGWGVGILFLSHWERLGEGIDLLVQTSIPRHK